MLDSNRRDYLVSAVKGTLGAVPYLGGLAAEIVGSVIPDQRLDRIAAFLTALGERIEDIERSVLEVKLKSPENIDLLEDSMFQASRALSNERQQRIASLFANALRDDNLAHLEKKRLLQLLGDVNDVELLILKHLSLSGLESNRFWELHSDALKGPRAVVGAPREELDKASIHDTYKAQLRRLALIRANHPSPSRDFPGFPDFKRQPTTGDSTTDLGRLLLRFISEDTPSEA